MNRLKHIILITLVALLAVSAAGCKSKTVLDYGNEQAFEAALVRGENLEGKTVSFVARELHPDSKLGYNIWSGEHLNFVSSRNPDIKEGSTVTARATTIENILGSWVINYEIVNDAVVGESTIMSVGDTVVAAEETVAEPAKETEKVTEKVTETPTAEPEKKEAEKSGTVLDYGDAEAFEAALNNGENLEGKTVAFLAAELHPDSKLGYNIWSGEHLNFVTSRNPGVKEGSTVTARATKIENILGSWVIAYEIIDDAVIGDTTIRTDAAAKAAMEKLPLELTDYGLCKTSDNSYSDTIYLNFVGMIHNPNTQYVAEFPKLLVTLRNPDGSILATEDQVGMAVMPEDTITLVGMISVPAEGLTADTEFSMEVDCSGLSKSKGTARTTDFVVENVSERDGDHENFITGEITNTTDAEIDSVNVSLVLRKEGKIVFVENTFEDDLKPGKAKAFEFQRYEDWPEHDSIEVAVQEW